MLKKLFEIGELKFQHQSQEFYQNLQMVLILIEIQFPLFINFPLLFISLSHQLIGILSEQTKLNHYIKCPYHFKCQLIIHLARYILRLFSILNILQFLNLALQVTQQPIPDLLNPRNIITQIDLNKSCTYIIILIL